MFDPKFYDDEDDKKIVAPLRQMKKAPMLGWVEQIVILFTFAAGFYLFFFGLPGYTNDAVDCQSASVTSLESQHTIIFKQPDGCSSYKAGDLSIEARPPMSVPDGLPEPSLVPEEYSEPVGP